MPDSLPAFRTPEPGTATVLIADADAGRRTSLAAIVRRFDPTAQIAEASDGEGLIEAILTHRPALGFVGLQLDGLSGPEAVALARKRGGSLPCLVLVAARVFPQWQELAQSLNAYEVLKTPLDPEHIENLLGANARRRQPTSVLLASSSEAGRGMIGRVLTRSGFNLAVDETDSGRHALKLLRMGSYALAFIDANIAGLDGLELACQVQPLNLPTQLTLMTSGDPEPIAHAARYFGVSFVLRMPFYARDIDLALHHALGLRRPYLLNAQTAAPAPTALLRVADFVPARRSA
ncbi:CheY-like chemotaxis protein [Methylobacterium sp. BE186]|uniref:response regulator n=1 Tax=Methylobacterium sp. BE186 TaxID=2817715 RepID=UPI002854B4D7|nr:response regulator [Methylobacterium sp. BE186]MDR7039458.1 CheY-like chemotaxis protein [Methylobacterium sp. BE186]